MNNDNSVKSIFFICITLLIALSCKNCWKLSVGIIGMYITIRGVAIIYCHKPIRDIHPSQELSIIIDNNPDFSRLYIEDSVSPLHQPLFVCSICLDDSNENVKTLLCGHKFHKDCIEEWLNREESCPMCRIEFNL